VARTLTGSTAPDGAANRYFYPVVAGGNQLLSTSSTATMGSVLASGAATIGFTAPGVRGWLDIILAVPDYLKYNWGNCMGQSGTAGLLDDLPCARATFGVYKSPLIYQRENY
jgi:MSHA biogenesis protein MshQ